MGKTHKKDTHTPVIPSPSSTDILVYLQCIFIPNLMCILWIWAAHCWSLLRMAEELHSLCAASSR